VGNSKRLWKSGGREKNENPVEQRSGRFFWKVYVVPRQKGDNKREKERVGKNGEKASVIKTSKAKKKSGGT